MQQRPEYPNQNPNYNYVNNSPVSIGDWILTFILLAIPFVNVILVLVWACSSSTAVSKRNFAKAILIMYAIGLIMLLMFFSSIAAIFSNLG